MVPFKCHTSWDAHPWRREQRRQLWEVFDRFLKCWQPTRLIEQAYLWVQHPWQSRACEPLCLLVLNMCACMCVWISIRSACALRKLMCLDFNICIAMSIPWFCDFMFVDIICIWLLILQVSLVPLCFSTVFENWLCSLSRCLSLRYVVVALIAFDSLMCVRCVTYIPSSNNNISEA